MILRSIVLIAWHVLKCWETKNLRLSSFLLLADCHYFLCFYILSLYYYNHVNHVITYNHFILESSGDHRVKQLCLRFSLVLPSAIPSLSYNLPIFVYEAGWFEENILWIKMHLVWEETSHTLTVHPLLSGWISHCRVHGMLQRGRSLFKVWTALWADVLWYRQNRVWTRHQNNKPWCSRNHKRGSGIPAWNEVAWWKIL